MTLTQMEYALAVQKTGSVSRAAELCRITQPTLTQQLRKLEDVLGLPLFERGKQPLRPTPAGLGLLRQAARVVAEAAALDAMAKDGAGPFAEPFRLGVIPSVAGGLLPRVLPALLKALPAPGLSVVEAQTGTLVRALLEGELDAGIAAVPLEHEALRAWALYRETFSLYFPPRHALLRRARVPTRALLGERLLLMAEGHCFRRQALDVCGAAGVSMGIESGSFETLIAMVDQGLGVTILPRLTAESLRTPSARRRLRPFEGRQVAREIALIQPLRPLRTSAAQALVALVRRLIPTESGPGRVLDPGVQLASI